MGELIGLSPDIRILYPSENAMKQPVFARPASAAAQNGSTPTAPAQRPRLCLLSDLLDEWQSEAEAAHEARVSQTLRGPITGFKKLDEDLGGCLSPGLHIVHGQPGTGKTAWALQVAAQCGFPCLYVTCEMAPLELLRRHTARVTKTYLGRLKSGEIGPRESLELAQRAVMAAPYLALVDATRAGAETAFLSQGVEAVRLRAQENGADSRHVLLVVDSLHSWAEGVAASGRVGEGSEYEILNAALLGLRGLSHSAHCPIVAISERNREAMKSGGLSAGAGTRKLEYGAESVLDLSRVDEREDAGSAVGVTARLVKNRSGASGKETRFSFHGATQTFEMQKL